MVSETFPFEESFLTTEGGARLYLRSRSALRAKGGAFPTLLFCDGLGCDGFVFKRLWPRLEEFPLCHFQYRGHGKSEPIGSDSPVSIELLARDLNEVLASLPGDVVVVGHSLGAQVALAARRLAARELRERTRALVILCGTSGRATHTFKGTDWLARAVPLLARFVEKFPGVAATLWDLPPPALAVWVGRWIGDIPDAVSDEDVIPYFEHLKAMTARTFLRFLTAAGEHDESSGLAQLGLPTLVVAGGRDSFTPPELAQELAQRLTQGTLVHLAEATHLAPLEAPNEVSAILRRFFADSLGIPR